MLKLWNVSRILHAYPSSSFVPLQAYLTTHCQDWLAVAWFHPADRHPGCTLLSRNTSFLDLAGAKDQDRCSRTYGHSNTSSDCDNSNCTNVNKRSDATS